MTQPTKLPKTRVSLYCIRTDAVLLHPSLPGFPITGAPTVAAKPDSTNAQFMVAAALPPIHWPTLLGWYHIKQPRRAHIWPLRALLHLYLMVSLRHALPFQFGPSLDRISQHPELTYQQLLSEGMHYLGNFWARVPEMVLLALSIVREPMLPTVLMALAATAEQADTNQSTLRKEGYAVLELCSSLSALLQRIQPALGTQNQAALDLLAELGLTRRRAGVLERALFAVIQRLTRPGEPLPVHRITTTTGAPENKLLTQHKSLIQNSLGESPAALTGTLTTPHYGP